jgi:integrase
VSEKRGDAERIVPSPNDPMAVARAFVGETYISPGGVLLLRHHRNTFYRYAGDHWPEDDERRVASELWRWLEERGVCVAITAELVGHSRITTTQAVYTRMRGGREAKLQAQRAALQAASQ